MRKEIKPGIWFLPAIDWERRLFDELIHTPDGTSYNAYLVKGSEKVALIDTVEPEKGEIFLQTLKELTDRIDYIISQHGEQDHSGLIPEILRLYPEAVVVTNKKGKDLLKVLLHLPEDKFKIIEDGDTLSLGDKTLKFIFTPWAHWPETFSTYVPEDKVLFTCDLFGSHIATSEVFLPKERFYLPAKRYFAELMLPFRAQILKNVEKLEKLDVEIICPSHGCLYKESQEIFELYKAWSSEETKNLVLIPYVSMHKSTEKLVYALCDALNRGGIDFKIYRISVMDTGELAMDLVDATTLILACPMVLAGPHPLAVGPAYLVNVLRPKLKVMGVIGSYGWGGRLVEVLKGFMPNLKAEFLEPVLVKGLPTDEDYKKIENLAEKILEKHKSLGLIK